MSRVIFVAAFLVSLLLPGLGPKPAYACSCAAFEPERLAKFVDVIVVGTVDDVENPPPDPRDKTSSLDPVYVSVTVERYLKGSGETGLKFSTARDGASCGALETLEMGNRHVLFLSGDASNYTTSLCSGNAPLGGVSLMGIDGAQYLSEIETITGPGVAPETSANEIEAITGPGVATETGGPVNDPAHILERGFIIAGLVAAALAAIVVSLLAVRLRRTP